MAVKTRSARKPYQITAKDFPARNVGRLDIHDGRAALSCALHSTCTERNTSPVVGRRVCDDGDKLEQWLCWLFRGRPQHLGRTISGLHWNAAVEWGEDGVAVAFGFWHPQLIGSAQVWRGAKLLRECKTVLERMQI